MMVSVVLSGAYLYLVVCVMDLIDWIECKWKPSIWTHRLRLFAIINGLIATLVFTVTVYREVTSWLV